MFAQAHVFSVQECVTVDDDAVPDGQDTFGAALDVLTLAEVEETAGELHRRIAAALRDIGERRADTGGRESPRARVAALAVSVELATMVLGAAAAGEQASLPRLDAYPATVAAAMYAAATIQALLGRLDQDRRLLASLARTLEARLDEECDTPWGTLSLRRLVTEILIVRPARVAMALEEAAGEADV